MADNKISAHTELAETPAPGDFLILDDVSDSTQSASGTTKKLRVDRLYSMPGNVTLGDDASDTLTVNSGIWTLGSNYVATRAAGALAAGITTLQDHAISFSGDAGGSTTGTGYRSITTVSGANALTQARAFLPALVLSTSAGVTTNARAVHSSVTLSGAGTATNASIFEAGYTLSSSGGITNADHFLAGILGLTSTGAITTLTGFRATNQGHATLVTNALAFDHVDFTGAVTLTVGYRSQMTSGTGKWAFYASGTANNALAGSTRFGSTVAPTETVHVTGTLATSGIGAIGTTTSSTTTLNLPLGATGVSSMRIAQGVAPSSPVTGDMWTTALGVFTRTTGGTRGPHGYVLQASGAQVADPGNTTAETTYATVTVPANALGANGYLIVRTTWVYTSSANNKTLRVKFGTGATQFMTFVATTTTQASSITAIMNRNATNAQIGGQGAANLIPTSATAAIVTSAEDTTAAQTLLITGQTATGTETLTLERYSVEIYPSP